MNHTQPKRRAPKRLQLPNFTENQALEVVVEGRRSFQQGNVVIADPTSNTSYKCLVKENADSDNLYTVKFTFSTDWVEDRSCTCGYEKFSVCAHIMAALFKVFRPNDVTNRPFQLFNRSAPVSQFVTPLTQGSHLRHTQTSSPNPESQPIFEEHKHEKEDSFPHEAVCPICLGPWNRPVTLPCGTHSACQECVEGLYDHCTNIVRNKRIIQCPICRNITWEVQSKSEFVPNSDLIRVTEAYGKDKARWEQRVLQASVQKEDLKDSGLTPSSASSKNSLATLERKVEHCYEVLEKKYHNAQEVFQGVLSKNRQPGEDNK